MLHNIYNFYDCMTATAGRAVCVMNIEAVMDRYGLNLSAARVLKLIDRLVSASRQRGVKDRRGLPYCYASKEWIAGKLGKSVRTVARAIRDLKDAGLIECQRTKGNALLFLAGDLSYGAGREDQAGDTPVAETPTVSSTAEPCYALESDADVTSRVESSPILAMNVTSGNDQNGASRKDQNGTSNIIFKSYNNKAHNPSIDLSSARERRTDRMESPIGREPWRNDGHFREADEREKRWCDVHVALMNQLGRNNGTNVPFDPGLIGVTEAATIASYVADAVAGGAPIRVNGANMSPESYWSVVQKLENTKTLKDTLSRIVAGAELGLIRCERAYMLSAIYNCALWQRCWTSDPDYDYWFRRRA